MPKNNSLKSLAAERGVTVKQLVKQTVTECDGKEHVAAALLGVWPYTIRWHLKQAEQKQSK